MVDSMVVIGIESTAHTFGVGICRNGRILSSKKAMYPIKDKGMIPIKVSNFHMKNAHSVIKSAIEDAGLSEKDIGAIGYTKGPGLGPCLAIGLRFAKEFARRNRIPIFPVNHAVGHIEIARQTFHVKDPLVLYVSGGNSQILALNDVPFRHYHIYGETFDVGVGNMLDSFAREAKIVPSWGSQVAKVARNGRYIEMPYTVKGMDFTFTGLLTYSGKLLKKNNVRDVAYSIQETAFSMLCEATERALLLTKKNDIVLCGGVAQSERLREMVKTIAKDHKKGFFVAPNELNADNGAMIAVVAEKMMETKQHYDIEDCDIKQRYRIDDVKITW